jgi:16S rRNA (cytosine1402-N4)-methyltransferase
MLDTSFDHVPVLRQSVKTFLALKNGDVGIDATLGLGGHTMDMIEAVGSDGYVFSFDQDRSHLEIARGRIEERFGHEGLKRVALIHSNFVHLREQMQSHEVQQVHAILFDLGLALPHLTRPERGFSFQHDGPLDMRMNRESQGATAADIVNTYSEKELADLIFEFGEERFSRKIASAIVEKRKSEKFFTTKQLEQLVWSVYPASLRHGKTHPATRTFQALRIAVNEELDVLRTALPQAVSLLVPGGRLVVISYHSLEDRIVKHFFKDQARECICPPEIYRCECAGTSVLRIITKTPVVPSGEEVRNNPRSRSAKLRCAERV